MQLIKLVVLTYGISIPILAQPIALHPNNPHYFIWRGKPTILISSGEHYGALINLDFDFHTYLQTLAKDGLNLTRTFSGIYIEPQGAFNITSNTLAPAPHRLICPWARSHEPGYINGGNKFDLNRWDESYFRRLKEFVHEAARCGIIVELTLFCPFYEEQMWQFSPMHPANNINNIKHISRTNVYTLDRHGGLLKYQENLVRKIVTELRDYENIMYEICNEPYFGGVTMEWQYHIVNTIVETEKQLGVCHLITQNIANGYAKIENPHPYVSVFNFHYACPPLAVKMNYHLNRVIGNNETGFKGTRDKPYRIEGWNFVLAGGALFNHLDYSFAVGFENGTFNYPPKQPGGGSIRLRRQFAFLKKFIEGFNFIDMKPSSHFILNGLPNGYSAYVLENPPKEYAIYISRNDACQSIKENSTETHLISPTLELDLKAGMYHIKWFNPELTTLIREQTLKVEGNKITISTVPFKDELAISIKAINPGI